ncbi:MULTISPECIES: lipopolysaccharide assembly protein LapA domain-containing protein [unclassified Enterococcus]|uniref:LapA family protein n=1 Tax=unclassified Enterococcus TaxID=2608891 RepID=UPI001980A1CA|nr:MULTISPECIES: lipopolysaccharide assembly protein LapA domain-containing protein [unclassified Enterococcus]
MKSVKKQSNVIVGFLLVLVIVLFAVLNNKNVPVSFGFASFSAPLILVIIGSALIGALIVFLTAWTTLWQQKKQIKNLTQENEAYQAELQKKIDEAKEEQNRQFRNERAELEAAYQAELQAKEAQISQLKEPVEQQKQAPKQSFNYFD